jgi:hypothetical protein
MKFSKGPLVWTGCAGLQPTCAAIRAGKDICLANKETLIAGGPYVLPLAKQHNVHILPADSEHSVSSLFQLPCLCACHPWPRMPEMRHIGRGCRGRCEREEGREGACLCR